MTSISPPPSEQQLRYSVAGLEYGWDLAAGSFAVDGVPHVAFPRDGSLARLLVEFLASVGTRRFSLMMLAEGQRGTDDDWAVISAGATFEDGFADLSRRAHAVGWGRWELVDLDRSARTAVFHVHNGWEGAVQRAMGIIYGVGLVAGKFTAYCRRLFGAPCWPRQTAYSAEGQPYDEIVVEPSERSVEDELSALAGASPATAADQHRRALAERDHAVSQLQEARAVVARQRAAIAALSAPIVQLWDGVIAVPVVDALDDERTSNLVGRLLPALLATRSRFVIVDLTGLWGIDAAIAENLARLGRSAQQVGCRCVLSGLGQAAARTLATLAAGLADLPTHPSLRDALRACIAAAGERHG